MVEQMNNGEFEGLLFFPQCMHSKLPLLVYLHGAGERGTNRSHLYRHAVPRLIGEGKEIPAVVLCPQCPTEYVWNNLVRELKEVIDETVQRYEIDQERIALTGSSMGGFGAWEMGMTYPTYFSVLAPVAGGGLAFRASNLRTTPVWAFHGTADTVVESVYSELMVDAVNRNGGNALLKRLEGFGHNDGIDYAYRHTGLIQWCLQERRTNFEAVPEFLNEWF